MKYNHECELCTQTLHDSNRVIVCGDVKYSSSSSSSGGYSCRSFSGGLLVHRHPPDTCCDLLVLWHQTEQLTILKTHNPLFDIYVLLKNRRRADFLALKLPNVRPGKPVSRHSIDIHGEKKVSRRQQRLLITYVDEN